ncbi:hypothetical protein HA050_11665 [Iodobacter sp. HSC-16F04]|uniref:Transmembrane protein n=1 Tax=Iodobacter violaceini TaxID=3044271 RepID=A0ABX0KWJ7_9NEIS|nr:hypothetical protein [Iodobacter violacea]NHQ86775.1 hypothetical protein [Iodobacter violacea]
MSKTAPLFIDKLASKISKAILICFGVMLCVLQLIPLPSLVINFLFCIAMCLSFFAIVSMIITMQALPKTLLWISLLGVVFAVVVVLSSLPEQVQVNAIKTFTVIAFMVAAGFSITRSLLRQPANDHKLMVWLLPKMLNIYVKAICRWYTKKSAFKVIQIQVPRRDQMVSECVSHWIIKTEFQSFMLTILHVSGSIEGASLENLMVINSSVAGRIEIPTLHTLASEAKEYWEVKSMGRVTFNEHVVFLTTPDNAVVDSVYFGTIGLFVAVRNLLKLRRNGQV